MSLEKRCAAVLWYHAIQLPGFKTPGHFDPSTCLPMYGLPADLAGCSVLDIAAWDGFFSFECERRGAARVVASDSFAWQSFGTRAAGFDLAREVLGSQVESLTWDPADPFPTDERFDLVLLFGLIYHRIDAPEVVQRAAGLLKPGGLLILETHIAAELDHLPFPAARFYERDELCCDPTNWFGPNTECVLAWVRVAGLEPAIYCKTDPCYSLNGSTRLVVHARQMAEPPPPPVLGAWMRHGAER